MSSANVPERRGNGGRVGGPRTPAPPRAARRTPERGAPVAHPRRGPLLPDPEIGGPRVLLGLAWALITLAAVLGGSVTLSVWFAGIAGVAAAQAARTWKQDPARHPEPLAAAAGALFAVLGAGFGVVAFVVTAAVGVVGAAVWASTAGSDAVLTAACATVPVIAAASPVLLRATDGLVPAFVLLAYVAVHDAASFVVGSGARFRWEGPLAGMACIGSVTIAVAAIFPQFKGASAWELGALAALLTPLGPAAASLVLGNRLARAPAVRRLDSLLLTGPIWALAAAAMLT